MQLQVDHGPSLELKIGESGISLIYSERNTFGILFVCFYQELPWESPELLIQPGPEM